ncbi:PLD nuclease N-terminal domain-containing protein [Actinopolymorpha pittospori]
MTYPLLGAFLTIVFFTFAVLWIFLLVKILADIFRSPDLGGWGKAGWCLFVLVLPFIGVLAYLVARGQSMTDRTMEEARRHEEAFQDYIRRTAHTPTQGDGSVQTHPTSGTQ